MFRAGEFLKLRSGLLFTGEGPGPAAPLLRAGKGFVRRNQLAEHYLFRACLYAHHLVDEVRVLNSVPCLAVNREHAVPGNLAVVKAAGVKPGRERL